LILANFEAFKRIQAVLQNPTADFDQITLAQCTAVITSAKVYQPRLDEVIPANDWQLNSYMLRFDITEIEGARVHAKQADRHCS